MRNATLPPGDDERFVGYGVMGLSFRSARLTARHPATAGDRRHPVDTDIA